MEDDLLPKAKERIALVEKSKKASFSQKDRRDFYIKGFTIKANRFEGNL